MCVALIPLKTGFQSSLKKMHVYFPLLPFEFGLKRPAICGFGTTPFLFLPSPSKSKYIEFRISKADNIKKPLHLPLLNQDVTPSRY